MYRFLLFCLLFLGVQNAQATTETVKVYSDQSDGVIVTGPYPGSWSTQYYDIKGRYMWTGGEVAFPYTAAYNSNGGWLGIHRAFLSFDTSGIPSDAVIKSASLKVVPEWMSDEYNDQYSYMNVFQGRQASATTLTLDDIEMCGDVLVNPTKGAEDVDLTSIVPQNILSFPLNESGTSWVVKGGYTKLCLREGHDIENKEIINNTNVWKSNGIGFYTSEKAGTDMDPYLEVTYEIPDAPVVSKDMYDLLRELIEAVEGYSFSGEIEGAYFANLKKVEGFLNSAKYTPAENQIRAFIKKLEQDFKGGKITKSQYDDLYAKANVVLDAIPDDAFGTVPLITQVVSPYPSLGETTSWASAVYADGRANKVGDCGRTIAQCGCAISSLSMVGKYHGVDTGFDGTQVNPLNMNNWLLANGGYSHDGSVLWNYALAYMGREKNGKVMSTLSLDGYNETKKETIDTFVAKGNPSLGFSAAKGHYVVLTEVMPDAGYSINDPLWYNTKTTDDTRDVAGKVQDYNNVMSKANLIGYSPTLKPLSESIEIVLESPAELLVIDEKGRRLGYDMATGNFWDEIPGGTYDREDFILNPENPASTPHKAKRIYVAKPEGESFVVKVIGTGEGAYHASFAITDGDGGLFGEQIASTTRVGNVDEFTITTLTGTGALPLYLQNILKLVPSIEQKKFVQAFTVIAGQIEKDHVIPTEHIVEGLIRFIEGKYAGKAWAREVIAALRVLEV